MRKWTGFVVAIGLAASGAPVWAQGDPQPEPIVHQIHDGRFRLWLVDPQGNVDGILFEDGTVARFSPRPVSSIPFVSKGASLRADGESVQGGQTLFRSALSGGGRQLWPAEAPTTAPLPRGAEASLPRLHAASTVAALLKGPRGQLAGFVLDDGTTVRAASPRELAAVGVNKGDRVQVDGHGTTTPIGTGLWATSMTRDGQTISLAPAGLAPMTKSGKIARLLPNPQGDVDTILLQDGSVVRIPPTPLAAVSSLTAGTKIDVQGTGRGDFLRADSIHTKDQILALGQGLGTQGAPHAEAALQHVSTVGQIDRVLTAPDGEVDTLLLSNAAVIKLSPGLRGAIDLPIRAGDTVRVNGWGAQYPLGLSVDAQELQIGPHTIRSPYQGRPLGRRP